MGWTVWSDRVSRSHWNYWLGAQWWIRYGSYWNISEYFGLFYFTKLGHSNNYSWKSFGFASLYHWDSVGNNHNH